MLVALADLDVVQRRSLEEGGAGSQSHLMGLASHAEHAELAGASVMGVALGLVLGLRPCLLAHEHLARRALWVGLARLRSNILYRMQRIEAIAAAAVHLVYFGEVGVRGWWLDSAAMASVLQARGPPGWPCALEIKDLVHLVPISIFDI